MRARRESAEDPEASLALDGRTVDVVDRATGWIVLDGLFLKALKSGMWEKAD